MRPIDADEVLAKIDKLEKTCGSQKYLNWDTLRYFVRQFPTLSTHARWEIDHGECDKRNAGRLYCPVCLTYAPYGRARVRPNYCDECAAKMDLE